MADVDSDSTHEAAVTCASEEHQDLWEIGARAVWTLSSAKPGNGAAQLRDGDLTTYWQ